MKVWRSALTLILLIASAAHAQGVLRPASPVRGLEVYRHVCGTCHGLENVRFQDLRQIGVSVADIEAFAKAHQVPDGVDDDGDPKTRPAKPGDFIGSPFPSPGMARLANHGDLPPDFGRIALTHAGGAAWIERMLQSYGKASPAQVAAGQWPNSAMPRGQITMPPPLRPRIVTYADGTDATVPQMAADVAAFLDEVSHPHQGERRRIGIWVLVYLAGMTGAVFVLKRRVWGQKKD